MVYDRSFHILIAEYWKDPLWKLALGRGKNILVEQELPTIPEHVYSPPAFRVFCLQLFVFFFWSLYCLSSFYLLHPIT